MVIAQNLHIPSGLCKQVIFAFISRAKKGITLSCGAVTLLVVLHKILRCGYISKSVSKNTFAYIGLQDFHAILQNLKEKSLGLMLNTEMKFNLKRERPKLLVGGQGRTCEADNLGSGGPSVLLFFTVRGRGCVVCLSAAPDPVQVISRCVALHKPLDILTLRLPSTKWGKIFTILRGCHGRLKIMSVVHLPTIWNIVKYTISTNIQNTSLDKVLVT